MNVQDRLIKYVQIASASDPFTSHPSTPSHPREWDMAHLLYDEMKELGFSNIRLSDNCYLFGEIPANIPDWDGPVIGFICHMDTASEVPAENIKPQIIHYEGGDVLLNKELGITMSNKEYPVLDQFVGCDLICSDGTTLLGSDNKAAIAEVMTMAETLFHDDSIKHGKIMIGFTPDEEIGRGGVYFDIEDFGADFAYTLDDCTFGVYTPETFNAFNVDVYFNGTAIHTGCAKNILVNAVKLAEEFDFLLPQQERPEFTEKREGFYHLHSFDGTIDKAHLYYLLRDFDSDALEHRCDIMRNAANFINAKYGEGRVELVFHDMYRNMKSVIDKYPKVTELVYDTLRDMGVEPICESSRGGYDGCTITLNGLPCPNIGCSMYNCHGCKEFSVIQEMEKVIDMITQMVKRAADMSREDFYRSGQTHTEE